MTAEAYLERIRKIDAMLEHRIEDHHRWVEVANGLGGFSGGEKVSSGRAFDKLPNAVARYCDIEEEIAKLRQERKEIIDTIERLPTTEYKIIYKIYVLGLTIKETAHALKTSTEAVKKHKRKGLTLIGKMI